MGPKAAAAAWNFSRAAAPPAWEVVVELDEGMARFQGTMVGHSES